MNSQVQSQMFKSSQDFLMTYLKLSDKEKSLIGHSIKDLIKSCTFREVVVFQRTNFISLANSQKSLNQFIKFYFIKELQLILEELIVWIL